MVLEGQPLAEYVSKYLFIIERIKEMLYKRESYTIPQQKRADIISEIQRLNKKY